jgi:hypothetical protein
MVMRAFIFGGLALLAACSGPQTEDLLVSCPTPGLVPDMVNLTRYRDNSAPDLTNLVVDARLVGIANGRCVRARNDRSITVQFGVVVQAERGPASSGARTLNIPLVVGITDQAGNILTRQTFTQTLTFQANTTSTRETSEPIELILPVSTTRRGADYGVVVGFLLTENELALNRRRGSR